MPRDEMNFAGHSGNDSQLYTVSRGGDFHRDANQGSIVTTQPFTDGRSLCETHMFDAIGEDDASSGMKTEALLHHPSPISDGHESPDNLVNCAVSHTGDQDQVLTQCSHVPGVDLIVELYRQRVDLHREEKALTLRIKAICRRMCSINKDTSDEKGLEKVRKEADVLYAAMGGKKDHPFAMNASAVCAPFFMARDIIENERKKIEKQLVKLAKALPVAPYVAANMRGVGMLSLAQIVGEAGDLGKYATVARLWKRMGLAVMPDGRQRKCADATLAIQHGYNPSRRSVMFVIGDCIIKAGGHLREVYDMRKEYEKARPDASDRPIIHHMRAHRYMEKRLLRELWQAWRNQANIPMRPVETVHGSDEIED